MTRLSLHYSTGRIYSNSHGYKHLYPALTPKTPQSVLLPPGPRPTWSWLPAVPPTRCPTDGQTHVAGILHGNLLLCDSRLTLHLSLQVAHLFIPRILKSAPPPHSPASHSCLTSLPSPTSNPQSIDLTSPGLVPVWETPHRHTLTDIRVAWAWRDLLSHHKSNQHLVLGVCDTPQVSWNRKEIRLSVPQNYVYPQESSEYSSLGLHSLLSNLKCTHALTCWEITLS